MDKFMVLRSQTKTTESQQNKNKLKKEKNIAIRASTPHPNQFSTPKSIASSARKSLNFNDSIESIESTIVANKNSSSSSQNSSYESQVNPDSSENSLVKMATNANCTLGNLINASRKPAVPNFVSPQSYDPDFQNLSIFLHDYEQKSLINNWDDNLKLCYFSSYLLGQAQTWLQVYAIRNPLADWKTTVEAIKNEFSYSAHVNEAKLKLRYKRQQAGENVMSYLRDMQYLCDKVDPRMEDETRREHFEQGLLPTYAYQVKLQQAKSFDEVQKFVKTINDAENEIKHASEIFSQLSIGPQATTESQQKEEKPSFMDEIKQVVKQEIENAIKQQGPRANNQNYNPRTSDSRPVCFQCGKPGHKARVCFNNPQNQRRNQYNNNDRNVQNFRTRWPPNTRYPQQNGRPANTSNHNQRQQSENYQGQ